MEEGKLCNFDRIILIGMPCSGKTSISRSLAEYLGYEFIDMDEEIVKMAGMSIEQIFADLGEDAFRTFEADVATILSNKQKAVIATGGGVVTREGNMEKFRKPGSFIIFIHRDFVKLVTTPKRVMEKRPLLKQTSYKNLLALYKRRVPLYRKYANVEIMNDKNKDEALIQIIAAIRKYSLKNEGAETGPDKACPEDNGNV